MYPTNGVLESEKNHFERGLEDFYSIDFGYFHTLLTEKKEE